MSERRKRALWALGLLLVGALALAPRLTLSSEIEVGQPQWVTRGQRFWESLLSGELKRTFLAPHPGLPVLWIAGAAQAGLRGASPIERSQPQSRWVAVASVLVLLAACETLRRSLSAGGFASPAPAAILAGLALAFDPVLIMTTGLVGLDGIFSLLLLLTVLAASLNGQTGSRASWFGTLTAGGLATATKGAGLALLLAPFCRALARPAGGNRRAWKGDAALALGLAAAAAIAVFVLLPAAWRDPLDVFRRLLTGSGADAESLRTILVRPRDNFLFGRIAEVRGPSLYLVNFAFRATPLVLLGTLLGLFAPSFRRDPTVRQLGGFAIVFLAIISLARQKEWRYMIPLLAMADVLGALGWLEVLRTLLRRRPRLQPALLAGALLLSQAAWVLAARPYYELRLNPLLGGARAAEPVIQLGWTGGYYDALAVLDREAARLGRRLTWTGGSHKWALYRPVTSRKAPVSWMGTRSRHGAEDCRVQLSLSDIARDPEPDDWAARGVVVERIVRGGLEIAQVRCAPAEEFQSGGDHS